MATIQGIDAKVTTMTPLLDAIAADVQQTKSEIASLKAQIISGPAVSQAQLDSVDTKLDGVLQRLGAIDASVPLPGKVP